MVRSLLILVIVFSLVRVSLGDDKSPESVKPVTKTVKPFAKNSEG